MGAAAQGIFWPLSFCERLSEHYFVIRYDNRDVGQSSAVDFKTHPYTLDTLAEDALRILDAYEIASAHLVGASMGGMIAERVALAHPERVDSLTLIMSTGDHKVFTDALANRSLSPHHLPPPSQEFITFFQNFKPFATPEEFLKWGVELLSIFNGKSLPFDEKEALALQMQAGARARHPTSFFNHFYACDHSAGILDKVSAISVPTLLIHGDSDPLLPLPHAEALLKEIKQAQLAVVPKMGHFISEQVVEPLLQHLQPHLIFATEKKELEAVFKNLDVDFYFLTATPMLKILGVVSDSTALDAYNEKMREKGYLVCGEEEKRHSRLFTKEGVSTLFLEDSDPEASKLLRFRRQGQTGDFITKSWPRKKHWTQEEIVKALEVNLLLHMTYLSKYHPLLDAFFEHDITLVKSKIRADDLFNYALFARFREEIAERRIEDVRSFFGKIHYSWWVCEHDLPATLTTHLSNKGFVIKERHIGMSCDLQRFSPSSKIASHLRIERLLDKEGLKAFTSLLGILGVNQEGLEEIFFNVPALLYQEGAPLEIYVAFVNDIPVTTGVVLFHAGTAGIYYIATRPEERLKGYATAMMEHLLTRAKEKGYFLATLQTSGEAKRVYEPLGFEPCTHLTEWIDTAVH